MRRPLGLLLALALPFSSLPAEAQLRAAPPAVRAVASLPRVSVPALTLGAPALAPALALSPSLSPSLAPASLALLAPHGAARALIAAPAAAPLAAASPAPARASSPLPLAPGLMEAMIAETANDNRPAPAAAAALAAMAAPGAEVSLAFDGGRLRAASDGPALAPAPEPGPSGPRLGKPSLYRRVFKKKVPTAYRAFSGGLAGASLLAGLGMAGWGAIPWLHAPFVAVTAGLAAAAVLVAADLALALRPRPAPVAAPRATRWRARLAGALVGLTLAVGAVTYERPVIEALHRHSDRKVELAKRENVRAIPGATFARETEAALSENAVGRSILDELRDRSGVLRLPHFYVLTKPSVLAQYNVVTDAVYIDASQIEQMGYTVEQFLSDPAAQRAVVREIQSTLAHELTHAIQGRRSPLAREYWQQAMQHEYEAFVNELWYNHERLKADPAANIQFNDLNAYEASLNDLAGYLRELGTFGSYKDNVQVDNARWRAWRADLFARWPAHRVEGYLLLAQRAQAKGQPHLAQSRWRQARDAAKDAGLPEPAPLASPAASAKR